MTIPLSLHQKPGDAPALGALGHMQDPDYEEAEKPYRCRRCGEDASGVLCKRCSDDAARD